MERWTEQQAWRWHEGRPWIVGCNFIPSSCMNLIEIWQTYGHEQVRETMKRELALAASIGINCVRMLLPFEVWKYEREGFLSRLTDFLALADGFGIGLMPIFFDDCARGPIEDYREMPAFGKQPEPTPGEHGGQAGTDRNHSANPTFHYTDDRRNWADMESFVKDVVGLFREDRRILAWDIWNEPGNSGAAGVGDVNLSMEAMEAAFRWCREMEPVQPLTAAPWDYYHGDFDEKLERGTSAIERRAIELSDVVSFHYYGNIGRTRRLTEHYRGFGRPLLVTEWLHRPFGNHVKDHLPYYRAEGIGCFHWGLVNGKTQTHEPWDWIRDWNLDFTKWQHDLFHRDGRPYDEEEIEVFKRLTED